MRYEIWKGRKKVRKKVGSNSGQSRRKAQDLSSKPLKLRFLFSVLTVPITRQWAELV